MTISGYNTNFPAETVFDGGVFYIGAAGTAAAWATRGGVTFNPGETTRNTPYDGQKSGTVGLDRVTFWKPILSATLVQFGESMIPRIIPGAAHTGSPGHRVYTPVAANVYYIKANQYIANLRAIFQMGGGGFVEFHAPFALCTKWDAKGTDRQEMEVKAEFECMRDPSDVTTPEGTAPYTIRTISNLAS